jgi:hypothetical protein
MLARAVFKWVDVCAVPVRHLQPNRRRLLHAGTRRILRRHRWRDITNGLPRKHLHIHHREHELHVLPIRLDLADGLDVVHRRSTTSSTTNVMLARPVLKWVDVRAVPVRHLQPHRRRLLHAGTCWILRRHRWRDITNGLPGKYVHVHDREHELHVMPVWCHLAGGLDVVQRGAASAATLVLARPILKWVHVRAVFARQFQLHGYRQLHAGAGGLVRWFGGGDRTDGVSGEHL